ncbi:MAG: FabA/FabZ family ACP-dehydratase [bacterium]
MSFDDVSKRLRTARRGPLFDRADFEPTAYGRDDIAQILPHRGSMLLLDHIVGVVPGQRIFATRTIDPNDPVFEGHFPGDPVYPGALQIEAIGQAGLCLDAFRESSTLASSAARPVRLLKVLEAHFLLPVRPGDHVDLISELVEDNGYTFITLGQMVRNGETVSVGAFEAMFVEEY